MKLVLNTIESLLYAFARHSNQWLTFSERLLYARQSFECFASIDLTHTFYAGDNHYPHFTAEKNAARSLSAM